MINRYSIPLSLYIHVPWCVQKCPYCDFNSHAKRAELPENNYIEQLLTELRNKQSLIQGREIKTIFIGGGTPSLFSANAYQQLFAGIRTIAPIAFDAEITLEANPGTIEANRFADYRATGINRLSLGIQSFQDDKLKKLGRIHDSEQACRAIEIAKSAGFNDFNLDLMFGLPNQSIDDALYDLSKAFEMQSSHLSWYQLTLEPNTLFHKYPPKLPKDDYLWEMQVEGQKLIASQFNQYEISAYSKSGFQCQHNLNYWRFGDYLGIGAGAHSKITTEKGDVSRHWNIKHPQLYLNAADKIANQNNIVANDLPLEFMLNAARLYEPITVDLFRQRTGLELNAIEKPLQKALENDFLKFTNDQIVITNHGKQYLNELLELFMP